MESNRKMMEDDSARNFLQHVNFEMADIYMPLFIIQINMQIFDKNNRMRGAGMQGNANNEKEKHIAAGTIEEEYNDYQRTYFETSCKTFFVFRDAFLIQKVQITGTVVFFIKKETKDFIGIDDSTGVITCTLWKNDYLSHNANKNRRDLMELKALIEDNNVRIGSTLSILGSLEKFKQNM